MFILVILQMVGLYIILPFSFCLFFSGFSTMKLDHIFVKISYYSNNIIERKTEEKKIKGDYQGEMMLIFLNHQIKL